MELNSHRDDARRSRGIFLPTLAWLPAVGAAVVRLRGWTVDDFYITYRYAENLARGHGFVYNLGERVFGLSDPGLGLALALLHFVTRAPIDWLAGVLFGGALVGIAFLLLREGEACGQRWETILGGSLLVTSSFFWANQGAAAPLTLLALLAAAEIADRRPWTAGLLAGLAVWIRPDAGIGVALLLILLLADRQRLPWKTGLAAAAVIALGLLCAWGWFGSPLPGTMAAKIAMARAEPDAAVGAAGFWQRGVLPLERHLGPAWLLFVASGLAGLWPFAQSMRRLGRLTCLYGSALAVLYPWLGVPFFSWYALLPLLVLLYGLPFGVFGVVRAWAASTPERWRSWALVAGPAFAAGLVLLQAGPSLRNALQTLQTFEPPPRLLVYRQAARWLQQRAQPGDSVAYVEIGVLGFYSRMQLEDQMGLVTPRVLPFVARNDLAGGFLTQPTDYVVFHSRGRMAPIVKAPWFPAAYEEVARFKDRGWRGGRLILYHRRPDRPVP